MRQPTITTDDLDGLARRLKPYYIGSMLQRVQFNWSREEALDFVNLSQKNAIGFVFDPDILPVGLVTELVRVKDELALHHHKLVDSVVIAYDAGEAGGMYRVDDGGWAELVDMQIIDLPRGRKHGFKVGDSRKPFLLLVLSNAENTEADTYYD